MESHIFHTCLCLYFVFFVSKNHPLDFYMHYVPMCFCFTSHNRLGEALEMNKRSTTETRQCW